MLNFAQRLQAVLVNVGWNQADLCRETGLAKPTVSRWMGENGPIPSEGSLAKIANATACNLHWLKTGEGEMLSLIASVSPDDTEAIPMGVLIDIFKLDNEVLDVETGNNRVIPVVKTYDDEETQLHFYCIHCRSWHHHGRGGRKEPYREGRGGFAGDRSAHCVAMNSPYRINGVILDVVGKFSDVKKQYKNQRTLMCPKCRNYYSAAFNACKCGYINKGSKSKYPEMAKLYQSRIILQSRHVYSQVAKPPHFKQVATPGNIIAGPSITRSVPLISFVQAGDWTEAVEEFSPEEAEEFLPVTSTVGPRTFGLRVVGNSMEPEFREGEIVIVDPDREAETGSFVVAKINHDEATFKQLVKDGGSVYLRPLNSAYPVMDVTGRDLRIVGRVVEKVKRY